MEEVVLVIHLLLALSIIGLVLLQRSEGGGLGIGGRGGGAGNLATARGTASALTRATAICAAAFFVTSLTLGVMAGSHTAERQGILEALGERPAAETTAPTEEVGGVEIDEDGTITIPSAPLAE